MLYKSFHSMEGWMDGFGIYINSNSVPDKRKKIDGSTGPFVGGKKVVCY